MYLKAQKKMFLADPNSHIVFIWQHNFTFTEMVTFLGLNTIYLVQVFSVSKYLSLITAIFV